jgi:hypothetical protein
MEGSRGHEAFRPKRKGLDAEVVILVLKTYTKIHEITEDDDAVMESDNFVRTAEGKYYIEVTAEGDEGLVVRRLIEDALARSKKELDFTIGDEAFKARFANHERFNGYVSVYSSSAAAYIAAGIKRLRRSAGRLKRRLAKARR